MHLSASILSAIEENNFEEITAPIFVKGYLRAYARIVSLDEDDMILQYSDYYSEEDPPISSTSNMIPELSVADARIKWTTYLVILVLGVLLAAWWWNKEQNDTAPISLDSHSPAEEQASTATDVVGSEVAAVSEDPVEAVEIETVMVEPESAPEPEAETESEPESVAVESVSPEPVVEETVTPEPVEAIVEQAVVEEEAGVGTEPETPRLAQVEVTGGIALAPVGSDKLKIIVHADTWTDIKDANDFVLVYDLLRADETIELTGQAPFIVFLGNGHGVEIIFNGEEIDVAPRVRDDNTARLNIK
jgi:cytoskeleton protein RodZ